MDLTRVLLLLIVLVMCVSGQHHHGVREPGDPLPNLLDPNSVPKFVSELVRLPTLKKTTFAIEEKKVDFTLRARYHFFSGFEAVSC